MRGSVEQCDDVWSGIHRGTVRGWLTRQRAERDAVRWLSGACRGSEALFDYVLAAWKQKG